MTLVIDGVWLLGIVGAAATGVGGYVWRVDRRQTRHDERIRALEELKEDVRELKRNVAATASDVSYIRGAVETRNAFANDTDRSARQ